MFTWAVADEDGSDRVIVDIVPRGNACDVTVTHELHADSVEFADRTRWAWSRMLDVLHGAFS